MGTKLSGAGGKHVFNKARIASLNEANAEVSALVLLQAIYRDQTVHISVRMDAAKAAIPYEVAKKPTILEGGENPLKFVQQELRQLSDEELKTFLVLSSKVFGASPAA